MNEIKKSILIVEDELAYQHILIDRLGREGFKTFSAKNGEDGLAIALEKHPNLILLDLKMPKIGGIEMAKMIRETNWGKDVKIIVLTNFSDLTRTSQALENGIFQYFIKSDIDLEDLVIKIKESLK